MIQVNSYIDSNFLQTKVGQVVEYPDNSKEQIIFKETCKIANYFLTQIQTNNIKKNGELGRKTSWLKFKHYN